MYALESLSPLVMNDAWMTLQAPPRYATDGFFLHPNPTHPKEPTSRERSTSPA